MKIAAVILLALVTTPALSQTAPAPAPSAGMFASSAVVEELVAKAKSLIKPGQPSLVQPILQLAPYRANLEYRVSASAPNIHLHDAEFVYIVSGSGEVVMGGTLLRPQPPANGNVVGSGVEGGTPQKYAAGDTFIIPENTSHWFNRMNGPVVMITLHVPRPVEWQH